MTEHVDSERVQVLHLGAGGDGKGGATTGLPLHSTRGVAAWFIRWAHRANYTICLLLVKLCTSKSVSTTSLLIPSKGYNSNSLSIEWL